MAKKHYSYGKACGGPGGINCPCCRSGSKKHAKKLNVRGMRRKSKQDVRRGLGAVSEALIQRVRARLCMGQPFKHLLADHKHFKPHTREDLFLAWHAAKVLSPECVEPSPRSRAVRRIDVVKTLRRRSRG